LVLSPSVGAVEGVDIDAALIDSSRRRYPAVDFKQIDVVGLEPLTRKSFDLVYYFNSFYAFPG
jgi:hypothetical protein